MPSAGPHAHHSSRRSRQSRFVRERPNQLRTRSVGRRVSGRARCSARLARERARCGARHGRGQGMGRGCQAAPGEWAVARAGARCRQDEVGNSAANSRSCAVPLGPHSIIHPQTLISAKTMYYSTWIKPGYISARRPLPLIGTSATGSPASPRCAPSAAPQSSRRTTSTLLPLRTFSTSSYTPVKPAVLTLPLLPLLPPTARIFPLVI